MDALTYECRRQRRFQQQLESEGFTCVDDPENLYAYIGSVREVECYCESYTPKLLVKLYPFSIDRAKNPEKFWLVPLWQIVKFGYQVPKPGDIFKIAYVIGCRKVTENGYVPSLRLPLQ